MRRDLSEDPVEILAPAGDEPCLDAALLAGADAVYFGLPQFNARMRAANFNLPRLPAVMGRIHEVGARGYVALNTLVFDSELEELRAILVACAEARVDALIVQDIGVLSLARQLCPSVSLHASTQMTCTDEFAISRVAQMGVSRVILPRELSIAELRRIRASTNLALEVFVHGALCVSFSGQCQASLAMGGRSANRGVCAQPCRLAYELEVDGGTPCHAAPYVLSPMDLDASPVVAQLLDAGVRALKIEGRLKGPAYVASVVRLYRGIVDAWHAGQREPCAEPAHREAALQMFSRGSGTGFLEGTDHQNLVDGRSSDHRGLQLGVAGAVRIIGGKAHLTLRAAVSLATGDGLLVEADGVREELGGRVWAVLHRDQHVDRAEAGTEIAIWLGPERSIPPSVRGRRVFRTSAPRLEAQLDGWLRDQPKGVGVRMELRGELGQCPVLRATCCDGRSAVVAFDVPLVAADAHPLQPSVVRQKLGKLGGTPFVLQELVLALPVQCMLPWSSLNDARRRVVEALLKVAPQAEMRVEKPADRGEGGGASARFCAARWPTPLPEGVVVLCRTEVQVDAAMWAGADCIVVDFPALAAARRAFERLGCGVGRAMSVGVATLRVRKPGERRFDDALCRLRPDLLLVRSLGAWAELQGIEGASALVTDASIPVANAHAAHVLLDGGVRAWTPSWDVDPEMLRTWSDSRCLAYAEAVAYGARPMFHTQHCLYAAHLSSGRDAKSCGRPCERSQILLRDRVGARHLVRVDTACRNTVYEGKPSDWRDRCARWVALGVRRLRVELVDEPAPAVFAIVQEVRRMHGARSPTPPGSPGSPRCCTR
ncbi:MAG: U32 family peptidase [Polyangiaceae bacterium]|jgi:putative protease|nr:U32 family peptidase [Polyangiaceae bacterium]